MSQVQRVRGHLLVLLTGAMAFTCHKEQEALPTLDGLYQAQTTIKAGPLQLYTPAGVVTNPTIISGFLRRHPFATGSFLRRDSTTRAGETLTLLFQPSNRVTLTATWPGGSQTLAYEVSSRSAQQYVLAGLDSATITSSRLTGPCEAAAGKIREQVAPTRCVALPPTSNSYNMQMCRFRPLRVVSLQSGQPVLPYLSWVATVTRNSGYCGLSSGGEWNTVRPALAGSLTAGDTVVVQVNELPLQKR